MAFSDQLLEVAEPIWEAQLEHPFTRELAAGTLDEAAFLHWVKQDYRYLHDYARVFAVAGTKARDEETMSYLLGVSHGIVDGGVDFHRDFAADYGLSSGDLESTEKAPTCVAYTNHLLRVAYEGSLAEIAAAIYPCGQGYRDVAAHMAEVAEEEHRYTPFIEKYTGEDSRDSVERMAEFVDDCAERWPGERDAMREAFLTSARLELAFWEMAYTQETWDV